MIDLLADQAPGLLQVLRENDPDYVLLDGTLAECDRLGHGRDDHSAKHRRHGVNVQVITDPVGDMLWISPALPGRCHDLTAARTHRIIRICQRQGVPVLADRAYQGVGPWVTVSDSSGHPVANSPRPKHRQPRPRHGSRTCRARDGTAEVLARHPQSTQQPESNDVNREGTASPSSGNAERAQ